MKIGLSGHPTAPLDPFLEWVRVVDDLGFDLIGMGDSPALWPEVQSVLAVAAASTRRVRLGSFVTNPVSRDISVAASAAATLRMISNERSYLGIGSGDSAVEAVGLKPARVEELAAYLAALKDLTSGRIATYQGRTMRLNWWKDSFVPIFVVAEGPRMLSLAGELADGVFIGNGISPLVMTDSLDHIAHGASSAGRKLNQIEKWWVVRLLLSESPSAGRDGARGVLATLANHAFRFGFEGKRVPNEYRQPLLTLRAKYDYARHAKSDPAGNAKLVEELGLTDFLADRYVIAGPPAYCAERLRELERRGADGVVLVGAAETGDLSEYARDIATHLMPLLK